MDMEYFCCFYSYTKKLAKLSDQEVGRLFRALLIYGETGKRTELAGRESIAFDFIADDIDRAKENYERMRAVNAENGKKGGRPKNRPLSEKPTAFEETERFFGKPKKPNTITNTNTNTSLKENIVKERKTTQPFFRAPTVEEVEKYINERGSNVDAHRFVDFYAAKGWMVGKNKMKDWKAAVRTWESRERKDETNDNAEDEYAGFQFGVLL